VIKISRKNITVRVDEETYNDFKFFVQQKHGITKGVIGIEVEQAMKVLMKLSLHETTEILARPGGGGTELMKKNKKIFPVLRKKDMLQKNFKEMCELAPEVSIEGIKKVIKASGFKSESTIEKYVRELVEWGYIEPISVGKFKNNWYNPEKADVEKKG